MHRPNGSGGGSGGRRGGWVGPGGGGLGGHSWEGGGGSPRWGAPPCHPQGGPRGRWRRLATVTRRRRWPPRWRRQRLQLPRGRWCCQSRPAGGSRRGARTCVRAGGRVGAGNRGQRRRRGPLLTALVDDDVGVGVPLVGAAAMATAVSVLGRPRWGRGSGGGAGRRRQTWWPTAAAATAAAAARDGGGRGCCDGLPRRRSDGGGGRRGATVAAALVAGAPSTRVLGQAPCERQ